MVDYIDLEVINNDNKNEMIVSESNEISIIYKTNITPAMAVNQDISSVLDMNNSMNDVINSNEMLLYVPNKIDCDDFAGLAAKRMVPLYCSKLISNNEGSSRARGVIPQAIIWFQERNSNHCNVNSQPNQSTPSTLKATTKNARGKLLDYTKINCRTNIVEFDVLFCNFGAKWNTDVNNMNINTNNSHYNNGGNRSDRDLDKMKEEKKEFEYYDRICRYFNSETSW